MTSPRSEVVALLRACKELPEEDVHRLVLSDWLEENATDPDELALRDLIRLQVEHDSLPAEDDRRKPLATQSARRLAQHGKAWLGTLDTDRVNWGLKHGLFVMTVHAADLGSGKLGTPGLPEGWEWVERLTVLGSSEDNFDALRTAEPLAHIGTIDLRRNAIGASGATALAESPRLANLCGLVLSNTGLGREGLLAILGSPHLHQLHRLELDRNGLNSSEMKSLADWPALTRLNRLSLSYNAIGHEGTEPLFAGRGFPQLRELHLRGGNLQTPSMRHLASADLPNLRHLDLSENKFLDADAVQELLSAEWIGNLERLSLGQCPVGENGVKMLAGCAKLASLVRLDLNVLEVNQRILSKLVKSRHLTGLRVLDLTLTSGLSWTAGQRRRREIERHVESLDTGDVTVVY